MEKIEIINLINSQFSDAEYPGDDNIFAPSSGASALAVTEVEEVYLGKNWNELDAQELAEFYDYSVYLSPTALKYYILGMIKAILEHEDVLYNFARSLIFYMTPPSDAQDNGDKVSSYNEGLSIELPHLDSYFQTQTSTLDHRQINIWVLFLQYLIDSYPNKIASDPLRLKDISICLKYWEKKRD